MSSRHDASIARRQRQPKVLQLSMSYWLHWDVSSSSSVMPLLRGVESQMARVHMTYASDCWRHQMISRYLVYDTHYGHL